MNYSDDTQENEKVKEKNGERNIITQEMLNSFMGGDNPNGEAWETLLDILNDIYPVGDCVEDIKEHWDKQ